MTHHRSIILINKKFQLRFAFYVCSWIIVLNLAYPLIIANLFDYFIHFLAADPMGPGLAFLQKTRQEFLMLLLIMQAVLLILAFIISIFMSHKIAGPLYKLGRFFHEAGAGNIEQELKFRKRDYFQELATYYNDMMAGIRLRASNKNKTIQSAISQIEKALPQSQPEIQKLLNEALTQLRNAQKT